MIRLLFFITIAGLIYWFWKWTMGRYNRLKKQFYNRTTQASDTTSNVKSSELVQDPVCKLFIAKESAIQYKDKYFCSEKCKNAYK